jgi:hypothetical protein
MALHPDIMVQRHSKALTENARSPNPTSCTSQTSQDPSVATNG